MTPSKPSCGCALTVTAVLLLAGCATPTPTTRQTAVQRQRLADAQQAVFVPPDFHEPVVEYPVWK